MMGIPEEIRATAAKMMGIPEDRTWRVPPELAPEMPPMGPPATRRTMPALAGKRQVRVSGSPGGDFMAAGPRGTRSAASVASVSSGTSVLPPEQRANKLGQKLAALAEEGPPASWNKLQEEFDVQKLVWESVGMVKGKKWVAQLEGPRSFVERALQENTTRAVEEALEKGDPSGEIYSNAMRDALKDVLLQERATDDRHDLAEKLRMAAIPATLMREETDKKALERLVEACHLRDDRLERLVRKTLLLPIPVGLGAPVDAAKTSSGLGRVAGARGSNSGSIGMPVTVASMSAMSTFGEPASITPKSDNNFEASPTVSGPYISMMGYPEPLTRDEKPSMGAAVSAKRSVSGPPKPRRGPSAPKVQQVDMMQWSIARDQV